ncbi:MULTISPECIES: hypothetical protein [unclassified Pseudomonas]|uniref:hypothetical protein n=1 Tax=unclassified Pseudomonas TaxID=196821 RepID=UPI001B32056E|nr:MULTISPECIES: hypothetical protein [unclassified Pseudomonas]
MTEPIFNQKNDSYSEIVLAIEKATTIIQSKKIRFSPSSALHKLFSDARKLEREWEKENNKLDLVTGINTGYAQKIANAIIMLENDPGIDEALNRMARNNMNLSVRTKSQGKDALWELSLLAALKENSIEAKLIDPPDIIVNFGSENYSIACKKIYEEKSLKSRLRDGASQISKTGTAGIIALNIDDLFLENHILISDDPESTLKILSDAAFAFYSKHLSTFTMFEKKPHVDGFLIAASSIADIKSTRSRLNMVTSYSFFVQSIDLPDQESLSKLVKALSA